MKDRNSCQAELNSHKHTQDQNKIHFRHNNWKHFKATKIPLQQLLEEVFRQKEIDIERNFGSA